MLLLGCHKWQVSSWTCSSPLGPASQGIWTLWKFPIRTVRTENLRECIQMRCSICIAQAAILDFVFKCFKFSLCWGSLYLSLFVWQRHFERNEGTGGRLMGNLGTMTGRVLRSTSHLNHLPDTGKRKPVPFSFSLSLFFSPPPSCPSPYGRQTMLSSEGWAWTAALASDDTVWSLARWVAGRGAHSDSVGNCLPALSALKCSLTPHPDCEEVHSATAALLLIPFSLRLLKEDKKKRRRYLPTVVMFLYGFVPLWFSDCCLVCGAKIFLILPAALSQSPSIVWRLTMCFRRSLRPGRRGRFTFCGTALFIET